MELCRIIREKKGITAYRMAEALGVTQTQYSYMEREAQSVSFRMLAKLRKLAREVGLSDAKILDLLAKSAVKALIIVSLYSGVASAQVPGGCYVAKPTEAQCSDAYIGDITLNSIAANVSFFGQTVGILVTEYQQTREILESVVEESGRKDDIILLLKKKLRRAKRED